MIIHDDRRGLIASAEAGDVADANLFCVGALKSGIERGADLVGSAEMAAHVGADADIYSRRRAQVKMRIEAGHGVNLTHGDIDFRGERCESVGGQVTEVALYGS
jgi:hypothetical protein